MTMKQTLFLGLTLGSLAACQTTPPSSFNVVEGDARQTCQVKKAFETTAFGADFEAEADRLMAHMTERNIAPGAVIRITQKGKTVFNKAYGYADLESEKPMETDSLFRIYSMTKAVTTMAALQLVENGKIALDDPISAYLPEFADVQVRANEEATETRAPERAPTVRDLITHTSGLTYRTGVKQGPIPSLYVELGVPGGPGSAAAPTNGMDPAMGNQAFVERIVQAPLEHDPGTVFTYSNSTDVLGIIVAKVSGQSLGEYMAENIFEPAGMTDTSFQLDPARSEDFTSMYYTESQAPREMKIDEYMSIDELEAITPTRIDLWNRSLYMLPQPIEFGGAGLVSDADDYLAFTNALMEGKLISDEMWDAVRSDQLPDAVDRSATWLDERTFGLGFALRTNPTNEGATFPHCGLYWSGAASTYYWIDPETETTGVLMTQIIGGNVRDYFGDLLEAVYGKPN